MFLFVRMHRFNHLDYDAPLSARTLVEERILEKKLAGRSLRPKGSNELASLRLATTTPRKAVRSQEEVESAWRASQVPKSNQTFERLKSDTDPKLVGPQPYGVPPNREDREWRVAQEYLRQHLHAAGAWDPNLDRKYTQADPSMGWTASGAYEVARGWMGFGLRVPEEYAGDSRFWNSWHTTYFPCPAEWLPTVLDKLECVIPGDVMLGGDRIKIVHMAQKGATEKIDPNSTNKDRCCTRLYTTPSIRYAAAKIAAITRGGGFDVFQDRKLYFVIECKQKGGPLYAGGFHACKETIGWEESQPRKSRISPHFENGEIEYYTVRKNSVVPYRVLVLTDDVEMVEVKTSDGSLRQTPQKQWKQVKWRRKDHPQYGFGSMPGLCPPFMDFADPSTDQPLSRGGTACPRASIPIVSYPEMSPIRYVASLVAAHRLACCYRLLSIFLLWLLRCRLESCFLSHLISAPGDPHPCPSSFFLLQGPPGSHSAAEYTAIRARGIRHALAWVEGRDDARSVAQYGDPQTQEYGDDEGGDKEQVCRGRGKREGSFGAAGEGG